MSHLAASPVGINDGYRLLSTGAAFVDLGARSRGLFHGARAAEVLNGLVTNEVAALAPGRGTYAAALTPKGKILADLRILRREEDVLVDVSAGAAPGWCAMVRKYVNPRLSRYEDVSHSLGALGVFGPRAAAILAAVTEIPGIPQLEMLSHLQATFDDAALTIARIPDAGVDGFAVYAPTARVDALRAALVAAGAVATDPGALDVARVEAGRPEWGLDMDDSTLTQEARMEELEAISYTKGCYTGQETVARVHFRGHVNRFLRGVRFPEGAAPLRGTELLNEEGTVVGDVRSTVISPRYGAIGLAMIRREVEAGSALRAQIQPDGFLSAVVTELPFAPEPLPA